MFTDWHNSFLWVGLILQCFNLTHFIQQRKLRDRNTLLFYQLMFLGIVVCLLGLVLKAFQDKRIPLSEFTVTGLATCIYLAQIMLPGTLLRFITSRLRYSAARRRIELVSRLLTLCGTALVILNIPFVLISYVSESGRLENGPLFRLYVLYMLAYYLLDLGYVWYRRQELGIHNRRAMTEACVCAIIGLIFQHFLHAQLFFGFTLAVAVTFLYLTLKTPTPTSTWGPVCSTLPILTSGWKRDCIRTVGAVWLQSTSTGWSITSSSIPMRPIRNWLLPWRILCGASGPVPNFSG